MKEKTVPHSEWRIKWEKFIFNTPMPDVIIPDLWCTLISIKWQQGYETENGLPGKNLEINRRSLIAINIITITVSRLAKRGAFRFGCQIVAEINNEKWEEGKKHGKILDDNPNAFSWELCAKQNYGWHSLQLQQSFAMAPNVRDDFFFAPLFIVSFLLLRHFSSDFTWHQRSSSAAFNLKFKFSVPEKHATTTKQRKKAKIPDIKTNLFICSQKLSVCIARQCVCVCGYPNPSLERRATQYTTSDDKHHDSSIFINSSRRSLLHLSGKLMARSCDSVANFFLACDGIKLRRQWILMTHRHMIPRCVCTRLSLLLTWRTLRLVAVTPSPPRKHV